LQHIPPCDSLTDEEEDFIKLLDSRELAASADERLLVHLLLRADSINRKTTDWRKLKVGLGGGLACLALLGLCLGMGALYCGRVGCSGVQRTACVWTRAGHCSPCCMLLLVVCCHVLNERP
jgi:hypothetical protein